jgi:Ca2+-binding RTX toxin-like protein
MRSFTRLLVAFALGGGFLVAGTPGADAGVQCDGRAVTIDLTSRPVPPDGPNDLPVYQGTNGPDVILGTSQGEEIHALGGADHVCAGFGADIVLGGNGKDRVFGSAGDDQLRQGAGGGLLVGGDGLDRLRGNVGNDTLRGGRDDDVLLGLQGNDALDGGTGVAIILDPPELATDTCNGGPGRDTQTKCEVSSNFP